MSRFGALLDILKYCFENKISVKDYHNIVNCIRSYDSKREDISIEIIELKRIGYPLTYHPCDHMENIRKNMWFDLDTDNIKIGELIKIYKDFQCL